MSFREEDRQKSNCPSRGLGLAAAAIGVGVGAALYYFFSKRQENPDGEASVASAWQNVTFRTGCDCQSNMDIDSDSYSTISEDETTDTSMNTDSIDPNSITSNSDTMSVDSLESDISESDSESGDYSSNLSEWDMTDSSMHINEYSFTSTPMLLRITNSISSMISPRRGNREFRERNWVTEECSICFEVIQRSQEVMTLPCSHNFHQACILPWLQEQQTCPNCRKRTE
ncbi:PREDICTED: E3 ubiquitin-protein ligase RLIM-like isoform X2 [Papilio xuthus]|uniref:RING-type E3 ubiquitin transferase n=1 Tax=Papilio xuthus TaxID=66420 RepID=I4DLE9_PAPXU|nr:uncharacterized protein LOC106122898 [Papilio xuthus]BAM18739.1 unknown unsecreted protein [Papilio xuthus]